MFVLQGNCIALKFSARVGMAKNLLRSRIGRLGLAELGGLTHLPASLNFRKLVDQIQMWCVARSSQSRPHPECVNPRAVAKDFGDLVLIQIARCEYLDVCPSSFVKRAPCPNAFGGQIPAIEANAGRLSPHADDCV